MEYRGWEFTMLLFPHRAWSYMHLLADGGSLQDVNELPSPMPGVIRKILVHEGSEVKAGSVLCVIEAMKMENSLRATRDGVVEKIYIHEGQQVGKGEMLLLLT